MTCKESLDERCSLSVSTPQLSIEIIGLFPVILPERLFDLTPYFLDDVFCAQYHHLVEHPSIPGQLHRLTHLVGGDINRLIANV